jgi:membrane protease YdiL (CAAX protease family)
VDKGKHPMKKITDWIKGHQVLAFFILTFVISWGLWFVPGAVLQREIVLLAPLLFAAACGPALAGIIISAVSNTESGQGTRKSFWIAFLVAWVISVLVAASHSVFINEVPISPVMIGILAVSVVPVAFVISSAYSRIPVVRNYLSSLIKLRGVWGWSLLALVFIPALILLSVPLSNFLKGRPLADFPFPELNLSLLGLIAVKFFYQLFFFNATGEEVGWRGFAMPRLQARTSPLITALIIALLWAPWHFFFWQAEGKPVMTVPFWVSMYIGHILLSIFIVWICNRAKGSILVAGIAHAATNTAFAFISLQTHLTWVVAAIVLILADRMWKKLPADHPAVYVSREQAASQLSAIEAGRAVSIGA